MLLVPGSVRWFVSLRTMGYSKHQLHKQLEQMERGWDSVDGAVCSGCVEDEALRTIPERERGRRFVL